MSQSEDNCYLSSSSANEKCTCSSSFALKPSQADVTSRMDACPKPREPPETDSKITSTLKSNKTSAPESSKLQMDLKNVGKNNLVGSKINFSNEFCEKVFDKELRCVEDGEVVKINESNADLEEGEIKDIANEKSVDTYNCRFYQNGSCPYGKDCSFFHISDKGLYNMFDLPITSKSYPSSQIKQHSQFVSKQKSTFVHRASKTAWDRALKAAKDRIKLQRKLSSRRENLRMTIQAIDKKFIPKHSPLKNRYSQRSMRNCSSNRKTIYNIASSKPKSFAKNSPDLHYFYRRSKTPKDMRWSPKSSCSSRSRSRSRSSRRCSSTQSPKRGRRVQASSNYLKRHASQSSESSPMCSSRKVSRRIKRRLREGRIFYKSCKLSDRRSPVKRLLPERHENESSRLLRRDFPSSRLLRRDFPRRVIQSKHQIIGKSTTLCTKRYARNCSDMSISPLSDASNRKNDLPEHGIFACSSDRRVTDMSISPIPDVSSSRFSSNQVDRSVKKIVYKSPSKIKVEKLKEDMVQRSANSGSVKKIVYKSPSKIKVEKLKEDMVQRSANNGSVKKIVYKSPSKIKVEKLKEDMVQIGSANDRDPRKKSCKVRSIQSSNNVSSTSTPGKLVKNDPLLMDLLKFYRKESFEQAKCVSKTHVKTTASELANKPANFRGLNEVKQESGAIQTNRSKKELLLRCLEQVNAALKRKKMQYAAI